MNSLLTMKSHAGVSPMQNRVIRSTAISNCSSFRQVSFQYTAASIHCVENGCSVFFWRIQSTAPAESVHRDSCFFVEAVKINRAETELEYSGSANFDGCFYDAVS
jgi:hypothetical protein